MRQIFDINTSFMIALGSNLSHGGKAPHALLFRAIELMERKGIRIINESSLYLTPAFPAGSGPNYVNAMVCGIMEVLITPNEIIKILHDIESELGRERHIRWGARSLDLDLIAVGDSILPNAQVQTAWRNLSLAEQQVQTPQELILPHPRLQDRAFVLCPFADLAPDWRHPLIGKTVREMLAALPASALEEISVLAPRIRQAH